MKLFNILIVILVGSSIAQAANLYKEDFSKSDQQTFTLQEKDTIRINYLGKETEIMLRSAEPEKLALKLTLFIEGAETSQYVTLQQGTSVYFDIDKDKVKDLIIQPVYISKENSVIIIGKASPDNPTTRTTNTFPDVPKVENSEKPKTNLKLGLYVSMGIVILGLLIFLLLRKPKKH